MSIAESHLDRIAHTLLYEGYMLWPYRRSSLKNQQRWTIGGVFPEGSGEDTRSGDPRVMQLECLFAGDELAEIDIRIRFLHRVFRQAARWDGNALIPVDDLAVADERYLTWDEAVEREVRARVRVGVGGGVVDAGLAGLDGLDKAIASKLAERPEANPLPDEIVAGTTTGPGQTVVPITIAAGSEESWLEDAAGERVGALVRSWDTLQGRLELGARPVGDRLFRVTVRLVNMASAVGAGRDQMLGRTFLSAHIILQTTSGEFISLLDPPAPLGEVAAACQNRRCWPVLVGEAGEQHTILASPIILYDYPQLAPESPGDLFDGTEIDHLLILNILGITEAEKAEMRASDPRAREILDRAEGLGPEQLVAMMGAIREFRVLEAG